MTKKKTTSQPIVVDADVVRASSSGHGGAPRGTRCRRALETILKVCHCAVVSPALATEYRNHASKFGMRWHAAMARRGKVIVTTATPTGRSRGWLQSDALSAPERRALEKDLHIVLAAQETRGVVLSADDTTLNILRKVGRRPKVGWARVEDGDIFDWLESGASADEKPL